ncbi:TlpA family protein disulfide reductase [Treponema sp. OttesenSCG-928-L16]|nr:TlpA family protein disulfide reductase [Treponema sp. OttesenSCG-928-L16]
MKRTVPIFFLLVLLSSGPYSLSASGAGEAESSSNAVGPETASSEETELSRLFRELGMTVFPAPREIPDFTVLSPENTPLTLSSFRGSYVFLNFWATWCPPCREEMPSMQKLHERLSGDDFVILAVSVGESLRTVTDFLGEHPYTFEIGINSNGSLGQIYAAQGIPATYILDRQGRVMAGRIGSRSWDDGASLAAFSALLRD